MNKFININEYFEDTPLAQHFDFYCASADERLSFFTAKRAILSTLTLLSEPIGMFVGQTKEHSIEQLREYIYESLNQPLELRLTDPRAWVRELK